MLSRSFRRFAALLLVLTFVTPSATALIAGNGVRADVSGDASGLAACQVVVLVRAVIVLDVEDRLGLAVGTPSEPAAIHVPGTATFNGTLAECRVLVRHLTVTLPTKAEADAARSSYVSGPAPVANETLQTAVNAWNVRVTGAGSSAAVCQYIVLVSSVVIGGGAYGLPTGTAHQVLTSATTPAGDSGADARCSARVGRVEVTSA